MEKVKLKQTSLDQTGVLLLSMLGKEKIIPLFSCNPVEEAQELVANYFSEWEKTNIFITNNLLEIKIEDTIEEYKKEYLFLPENYMEELLSGFSFIIGREIPFTKHFYA